MEDCIFCKIAAGEIGQLIYEDEQSAAFHDVNPQAPVHILVVPKEHIERLDQTNESHKMILGHLLIVANRVAKEKGIADNGYRVVLNNGVSAGQSVWHIHVHVLGGRDMRWPPG